MLTGDINERLRNLKLPKRFEAFEKQITQDIDLTRIVERVDDAAMRVEILLRQARDGGLGRFELFLGLSGAGKTTFFKTLSNFFEGVQVDYVPKDLPLMNIAAFVRQRRISGTKQIFVVLDRDNPNVLTQEAREFFETLRVLFREPEGETAVFWPITNAEQAQLLADAAWFIGRDSIVDLSTKGLFRFSGPPRTSFHGIADLTSRSITGQPLEIYGITDKDARELTPQSETIAEYYSRLEARSIEVNGHYKDILKEKTLPSVWILVAGDDNKDLTHTTANLVQGTKNLVDIDQIISILDSPESDTAYLKEWKKRRSEAAYLFRALDVRLFELPPNVALAAVRSYGTDELRKVLKLQSSPDALTKDVITKSAVFRAMTDDTYARAAYLKDTNEETSQEYRRVQAKSSKDDKKLNKALGEAIKKELKEADPEAMVITEKQHGDSNLIPDIKIQLSSGATIHLEPTWRTTGRAIPGELEKRQGTLSAGHIRKYLLEKVMSYVLDLGL